MAHSGAIDENPVGRGKERRAHPRYPILVRSTIMMEGLGPIKATARDFGLGGLFITFDEALAPQSNGSFCLIRLELNQREYLLRAKIAHADAHSAGVSFVNPDSAALEALKAHVAEFQKQQSEINIDPLEQHNPLFAEQAFSSQHAQQIIRSCSQCVTRTVDYLLKEFFDKLGENLLAFAKEHTDQAIINETFQDIEKIDHKKETFRRQFARSIDRALQAALQGPKEITDQDSLSKIDIDTLSLVDDEEFNVWLARSKIINRIEMEYHQVLSFIERRLGIVYDQPVDRQSNPYGPALFVDSFEASLELLSINKHTTTTCYDTFRGALLQITAKLYEQINNTLIENDIAPHLKIAVNKAPSGAASGAHDEDSAQEAGGAEASDETVHSEPSSATEAEAEPSDSGVAETLSRIENQQPIDQQNLYELVSELRSLQHQLQQQTQGGGQGADTPPAAPGPGAAHASPMPTYTNEEVAGLIASLTTPAVPIKGDGSSLAEFRKQLESRLAAPSPDGEHKVLTADQGRILDFTESVFESLLTDLQVAQSVRPWIERLGVPVMRVALNDDTIYTDRDHVVRQVINKLAELEILAGAEDAEEQAAVRRAFDWLTSLINEEFDGTDSVFHRAVQQLNILNRVQQDAYERNIKEVVSEVLREESQQKTAEASTEAQPPETRDDTWLRMVHRLQEGHWILFDAYADQPKRLRIAWIARHKGKFVFVNVMGRKDRIVLDSELATQFEDGSAVILDGQNDPAMDRAQYTMLQRVHKQLLYQASHDELTGLINRREFERSLRQALDDSVVNATKHAVVFADVDQFDIITNTFGYDAGDRLVVEFSNILKGYLDDSNVLARVGAHQFGLMLQETAIDDAVELIEDIMDELHDYRFSWKDNRTSISFSAGIGIITATTENEMQLFQEAESSCNVAKEMGGNRIQIYHAGSGRMSRRKRQMEWATRIDRALDENQLYLRCQKIAPIRHTQTHLPHYEILLGLSDELGGNHQLEEFIRAAEQYHRMTEVDKWVITNAFEWLANNEHAVGDIGAFTINLSGQSFNSDALIDFIYQKVAHTGVPVDRVCFEVTETAGISNLSDAADFIQTIKGTGCQFALDDFGSGMSSYSYLRDLPVDYLKIDGIFVKDIVNNPTDLTVVKSITEIAHFMDKAVIAEFVQNDEAVELLRSVGVDYAQGYGIDKPHRLDELLV